MATEMGILLGTVALLGATLLFKLWLEGAFDSGWSRQVEIPVAPLPPDPPLPSRPRPYFGDFSRLPTQGSWVGHGQDGDIRLQVESGQLLAGGQTLPVRELALGFTWDTKENDPSIADCNLTLEVAPGVILADTFSFWWRGPEARREWESRWLPRLQALRAVAQALQVQLLLSPAEPGLNDLERSLAEPEPS